MDEMNVWVGCEFRFIGQLLHLDNAARTVRNAVIVAAVRPEALLREARRQKTLSLLHVPEIGVLDPDEDIVRYLKRTGSAVRGPPSTTTTCS